MIVHSVKIWIICNVCYFLFGFIVLELKIRTIRNLMRICCFGMNLIFVTVIILAGMVS